MTRFVRLNFTLAAKMMDAILEGRQGEQHDEENAEVAVDEAAE